MLFHIGDDEDEDDGALSSVTVRSVCTMPPTSASKWAVRPASADATHPAGSIVNGSRATREMGMGQLAIVRSSNTLTRPASGPGDEGEAVQRGLRHLSQFNKSIREKIRVRVEIMGSQTCRTVRKSQPVLMMINPMISWSVVPRGGRGLRASPSTGRAAAEFRRRRARERSTVPGCP